MKKVFLPLILGLVLGACSRDNENGVTSEIVVPKGEVPVLVTKFYSNDGGVGEFTYLGDKLSKLTIKADGEGTIINFKYDGDLIVEKSKAGVEDRTTYSYKNNRLDKAIEKIVDIDGRGEKHIYDIVRTYSYENDNTVKVTEHTRKVYTALPNDITEKVEVYTFTFSDGNIVKKVLERNGKLVSTTSFTYDTNKHMFSNIKGFQEVGLDFSIEEFFGEETVIGKNNPKTIKVEGSEILTYDYVYEYNANGYPIKQTETYKDIDPNKPTISVVNFEYNK